MSVLLTTVYVSSATHRFNSNDLARLVGQASRNNNANDISGMLLYYDGSFMQALEGPEEAVLACVERIQKDPRHHGMIPILKQKIQHRNFQGWAMGCENADLLPLADRAPIRCLFQKIQGQGIADDESIAIKLLTSFQASILKC